MSKESKTAVPASMNVTGHTSFKQVTGSNDFDLITMEPKWVSEYKAKWWARESTLPKRVLTR